MWSALRARRILGDETGRQNAQAIAAAIVSTTVTCAFFDAFSFPMAAGVYFLMCGLAGALHRISSEELAARDAGTFAPSRAGRPDEPSGPPGTPRQPAVELP